MRKAGFRDKRFIAILAGVILASGASLLTSAIAYAADIENMGFSDSVALKLTSPPSNRVFIVVAVAGVMGIVALGLALAYGRNRNKLKANIPPDSPE